ncbi:hypothetical protein D3C73_1640580 [compost metagenome]
MKRPAPEGSLLDWSLFMYSRDRAACPAPCLLPDGNDPVTALMLGGVERLVDVFE